MIVNSDATKTISNAIMEAALKKNTSAMVWNNVSMDPTNQQKYAMSLVMELEENEQQSKIFFTVLHSDKFWGEDIPKNFLLINPRIILSTH